MNRRYLLLLLLTIVAPLVAQPNGTVPRARALLDRGAALEKAGRLDEAGRDYEAARIAAEQAGDRALLGEALQYVGLVQYYRGDTNAALVNLRRAYDLETATGDAKGQRPARPHTLPAGRGVTLRRSG